MESMRNGFAWFGAMNMSTGIVQNNFESFVVLFFLIIRTLIAYFIFKSLPKRIRKHFPGCKSLITIFISECVSMTPLFLVSATTVIVNGSSLSFAEKANNLFQYIIIVLCACSFYIKYLLNEKHRKFRVRA